MRRRRLCLLVLTSSAALVGCGDRSGDDDDAVESGTRELGAAVVSCGDLDGDGEEDLVVGAPATRGAGAVYEATVDPDGVVTYIRRISKKDAGFRGDVDRGDHFGEAVTRLDDVDGDGVDDLAIGAPGDGPGAVWILFLDSGGLVLGWKKIGFEAGGFTGRLERNDLLGYDLAAPGDLDGDGVPDLAVGAPFDNDGGTDSGAVWVLFLNADGTVKAHQKISALEGGFSGGLDAGDRFGSALARLGDLDGDGSVDLAAGAPLDDDGARNAGAVWLLFLSPDGTVKESKKISATEGDLGGGLLGGDFFGSSIVGSGDLDGDGVQDLAVGADGDGGKLDRGAVWILFLRLDGTVRARARISETDGGFTGKLVNGDRFGSSLALLPDVDGNGMPELVVGARGDHEDDKGALWVLFLTEEGRVERQVKS